MEPNERHDQIYGKEKKSHFNNTWNRKSHAIVQYSNPV